MKLSYKLRTVDSTMWYRLSTSITALAVACVLTSTAAAISPCEASDLCSLHEVSPYVGDISASPTLRDAARHRSFKSEIIIMCSSIDAIDAFLQSSHQLEQLGFGHILLLGLDESHCEAINKIAPRVGCVWSSDRMPPDMDVLLQLWNLRYRTAARLVRLGYNILLLDTDIAVLDDPYKYFKEPPFQDVVLLNQHEWSTTPNGGLLYIQNAKPDGPAAFVLSEIANRPYHWADDDWQTASSLHLSPKCMYVDQDAYADVLSDMASGYMLFPNSFICLSEAQQEDPTVKSTYTTMWEHHRDEEAFVQVEETIPDAWHIVAGGSTTTLKTLSLKMPNCRGWPAELGGRWYPQERGPYSSAFLDQLQQDAPDASLWPDPEDPLLAAVADRVPHEKFAFMPHWLGIGWWTRGRRGYWDSKITGNIPQQVFAHTHYIKTHVSRPMAKRVVPMSLRLYNWTLAQQAHGENLYFACDNYDKPCPDLKFLALTPAAEALLAGSASWQEFALVVQGLAQLGSLLHRTVAWPSLPCNTSWISNDNGAIPLELPEIWLPWTHGNSLMCTAWGFVHEGCLENGKGLLPWELHHLLLQYNVHYPHEHRQHLPLRQHHQHVSKADDSEATSQAAVINVIHTHPHQAHNTETAMLAAQTSIMQQITTIDASAVQQAENFMNIPLVLLDDLVYVQHASDQHQEELEYLQLQEACLLLNLTAFTERFEPVQYSNTGDEDHKLSQQDGADLSSHILNRGNLHWQRLHSM